MSTYRKGKTPKTVWFMPQCPQPGKPWGRSILCPSPAQICHLWPPPPSSTLLHPFDHNNPGIPFYKCSESLYNLPRDTQLCGHRLKVFIYACLPALSTPQPPQDPGDSPSSPVPSHTPPPLSALSQPHSLPSLRRLNETRSRPHIQ